MQSRLFRECETQNEGRVSGCWLWRRFVGFLHTQVQWLADRRGSHVCATHGHRQIAPTLGHRSPTLFFFRSVSLA
jgi:hypothetical protein